MGTYTKPLDLYDAQMKRFSKMRGNMVRGHQEIAEGGKQDMVHLTSGSIKKTTLRRLGHPFGRGVSSAQRTDAGLMRGANRAKAKRLTGRSRIPTMPINRQSGDLQRGIYMRRVSGGIQSFHVGTSSKHQIVLNPSGTKKTIGRGVLGGGALTKLWRARNRAFIDAFIRKQRTS